MLDITQRRLGGSGRVSAPESRKGGAVTRAKRLQPALRFFPVLFHRNLLSCGRIRLIGPKEGSCYRETNHMGGKTSLAADRRRPSARFGHSNVIGRAMTSSTRGI